MSKPFLTAREVSELLQCSLRQVRKQTTEGHIPHIKIGGMVRYNLEAILAMGK
ncbi:helix-turn-helix domain-containing protein [bacterium]|nr:helix-turn-helix domain-containing protein [bacterium]